DTVRLRSHHDLRNFAALDYPGGSKALETCFVDQLWIVDEETQPRDAALHTLYIRLATKSRDYFSSQHVIAVFRHGCDSPGNLLRGPGSALAFRKNPVDTQTGRGFTTTRCSEIKAFDDETEQEVVDHAVE